MKFRYIQNDNAVAEQDKFGCVLFNGQFAIENTLVHRYCAEVFCFVRKAPDIYDKAVVSTAGICRTSDTVRTADAKECAANSRYIRVKGLDRSPKERRRYTGGESRGHLHIAECGAVLHTEELISSMSVGSVTLKTADGRNKGGPCKGPTYAPTSERYPS